MFEAAVDFIYAPYTWMNIHIYIYICILYLLAASAGIVVVILSFLYEPPLTAVNLHANFSSFSNHCLFSQYIKYTYILYILCITSYSWRFFVLNFFSRPLSVLFILFCFSSSLSYLFKRPIFLHTLHLNPCLLTRPSMLISRNFAIAEIC